MGSTPLAGLKVLDLSKVLAGPLCAQSLGDILALLLERERTGVGGTVEAGLFDTATSFIGYMPQGWWSRGTEPQRAGSGHESLGPCQAFDCADRPLLLGVAHDGLWRRFCAVAGLQDLVDHPDFARNTARVANRGRTMARVAEVMRTRPRDTWLAQLAEAGIPCAPLHTLGELDAHPHSRASGMVREHDDERLGHWRSRCG